MMYTDTDGDQFTEIVAEWFMKRKPSTWGNSTIKARELAEAEAVGYRHGAALGLAALGNQMRRDKFKSFPNREDDRPLLVPMLFASDFIRFLQKYSDDWEEGVYTDLDDSERWTTLRAKFEEIVFDDSFNDYYQQTRKHAIMEGYMEASEEDSEWIDEEIQSQRSKLSPLEKALSRLEKMKKVN